MLKSLRPWLLSIPLALNPAPAYPDVATQMQAIFDRHEMSIERAPEIEAMMAEMQERWGPVSEQVEQAMAQYRDFTQGPVGHRMMMEADIPYTQEIFAELVAAYRAEEAYYQWSLSQLEHYFERHDATDCLVKLSQAREFGIRTADPP